MKLVIFGLTVSSSFGNGHATLWRGLLRSLAALGHRTVFFERDVPYYAGHRDLHDLPGGTLCLYPHWSEVERRAEIELADADAAIVTSFCPDALRATELATSRAPLSVFYDMDTPETLESLRRGDIAPYVPPDGYARFDMVLSFSGGASLTALERDLGARRVAQLAGSADLASHHRVDPRPEWQGAASYLGTYAADRQHAVDTLFLEPARRLPGRTFVLGGSMYPDEVGALDNVRRVAHVAPPDHAAFFSSSPITINATRAAMARWGHCPSGRIFEAAACATPVLSDPWTGVEDFFEIGREIFVASSTEEALEVLSRPAAELEAVGRAARARLLAEHTADHRARRLVELLAAAPARPVAEARP